MKYYETYTCGCVSGNLPKRDLPGYCEMHGASMSCVYRSDGKADNRRAREVESACNGTGKVQR